MGITDMIADDKVEPGPTIPEPEVTEPTTSPSKRPRTAELDDEGCAEKRQKTNDHGSPGNVLPDMGSTSWDISAMIQNALGSLDEQLHQPAVTADDGTKYNSTADTTHPQPTTARKVEQKRMMFSSNPYYVMRTMSLPLLGSLVSRRPYSRPPQGIGS